MWWTASSRSGRAAREAHPLLRRPVVPRPRFAPAPAVTVVDFVCEDDVRQALQAGRKIYIGPHTIVTPLAREFGERSDILVMAERRG